jgi:hypothetical protein
MDCILNTTLSKILLFVFVAFLAAVWLKVSAAMNWNLYGSAGVAIGLLAGIPLCIGNWTDRRFTSGLLALVVAVAAFGLGDRQGHDQHRERIRLAIADDKSFITALAEQKMMRQAPAFGGKPGAIEGYPDGVPMVVDSRAIPEKILQEATAEWNALPEAVKQKIRDQRVQITQQSFGENLEQTAAPTAWLMKIGMMFVVGIVAFMVASAPAIMALKQ